MTPNLCGKDQFCIDYSLIRASLPWLVWGIQLACQSHACTPSSTSGAWMQPFSMAVKSRERGRFFWSCILLFSFLHTALHKVLANMCLSMCIILCQMFSSHHWTDGLSLGSPSPCLSSCVVGGFSRTAPRAHTSAQLQQDLDCALWKAEIWETLSCSVGPTWRINY